LASLRQAVQAEPRNTGSRIALASALAQDSQTEAAIDLAVAEMQLGSFEAAGMSSARDATSC
jgi:thioredoxin-like negative regulator of GroEL